MSRLLNLALSGVALLSALPRQTPNSDLVYSEADVVRPKLIHKAEPVYSESARKLGLQGDVLMVVTIDAKGVPRDPMILSSLGHGLDEEAVNCVSKWLFRPATKDDTPVKFRATIDISFRLEGRPFDSKLEQRRTASEAVKTLLAGQKSDGRLAEDATKTMQHLAERGNSAAEFVVAMWEIRGDVLPKDETDGLKRLQAAAKDNIPAALLFLGTANMDGNLVPRDQKKGMALLRKAAALGSADAQFQLGKRYMDGDGVEIDIDAAHKYLQQCADSGNLECQSRLRQLLIRSPQQK